MYETVLLPMISDSLSFNWPCTPSVTFMFPWTLYSSFDVLEKEESCYGMVWTPNLNIHSRNLRNSHRRGAITTGDEVMNCE
ncbi:hypothetical protein T07_4245 [Trichinella nelsoni]|uniref:Uncharacterized protein n=1 Tax=Trichinella nelsoni TaxID=6336 RepID=A0A0V0S259_9BILA|nr:hypothetical protein T07_4245 [Trichinella nelsoni]